MAVRLNVLLVQSSRMSGLQSGINADLVFQLMGVPGVDLSIVNSLNSAEIAETDRLLLSSLENDLAVLNWGDADDSLSALAILGVVGTRAPHQLDPNVPAVPRGVRRLYMVDLRRGDSSAVVVDAMKQLLDQRRIVAVPLSIGGTVKPRLPVTQPTASVAIAGDVLPVAAASPGPSVSQLDAGRSGGQGELSDHELDALVDDLNASDW